MKHEDNVEEDDNDIIETSPNGRWQKLRKRVALKDSSGIDEAHLAYDTEEGFEVVWNQITFSSKKISLENQERLKQKFTTLIQLKHINLVRFYDFWVDSDQLRLVFITESMTSGTLKAYLRKNKKNNKVIFLKVWKRWCRQILSALRYLHNFMPPIIHGSVRCDSIFLQHNGLVKVGAICLDDIRAHVRTMGYDSTQYMAPELQEKDFYGTKVDIYAFGMCVLEMATLETPYSECSSPAELLKKVTEGIKPLALEKVTDPVLFEFISSCFASQESRPNADELLFHKFLHEVPMLKVMAAHYILRNGIPYNPKTLSKQLNEFLDEVRVGAWGTLANINLRENRRALKLISTSIDVESEGVIRVSLNIVFPDYMTRELVFLHDLRKDTPNKVAVEMVQQGLLCTRDEKLMTRHLTDTVQKHLTQQQKQEQKQEQQKQEQQKQEQQKQEQQKQEQQKQEPQKQDPRPEMQKSDQTSQKTQPINTAI